MDVQKQIVVGISVFFLIILSWMVLYRLIIRLSKVSWRKPQEPTATTSAGEKVTCSSQVQERVKLILDTLNKNIYIEIADNCKRLGYSLITSSEIDWALDSAFNKTKKEVGILAVRNAPPVSPYIQDMHDETLAELDDTLEEFDLQPTHNPTESKR